MCLSNDCSTSCAWCRVHPAAGTMSCRLRWALITVSSVTQYALTARTCAVERRVLRRCSGRLRLHGTAAVLGSSSAAPPCDLCELIAKWSRVLRAALPKLILTGSDVRLSALHVSYQDLIHVIRCYYSLLRRSPGGESSKVAGF